MKKKFIFAVLIMLVVAMCSTVVFAETTGTGSTGTNGAVSSGGTGSTGTTNTSTNTGATGTGTTSVGGGANFDPTLMKPDGTGTTAISNMGNTIIEIIKIVGISVSIIMLPIIAVRFFLASASPDGKADVKKQLQPYIIGVILIMGITAFLSLAQSIGNSIIANA